MWFTFALLSALFASVRRTNEKQLAQKLNHFTIGWVVQLLSLPLIGAAVLITGKLLNPFTLGPKFWIPMILLWIGFYPLNTFLYVNALKLGDFSKILPLQSLGPVLALLLGWLLLGQVPSAGAVIGILTVVIGVYALNLKGRYLHNPFGIFKNDRASRLAMAGVILVVCVGIIDNIGIKASNPIYFSFVSTIGAAISIYITSCRFGVKEPAAIRRNIASLSFSGVFFGVTYTTYLLALSLGPLAYVNAVRSSSMLMGVIIGVVYLKEDMTRVKAVAIAIIAAGSVILGLFG